MCRETDTSALPIILGMSQVRGKSGIERNDRKRTSSKQKKSKDKVAFAWETGMGAEAYSQLMENNSAFEVFSDTARSIGEQEMQLWENLLDKMAANAWFKDREITTDVLSGWLTSASFEESSRESRSLKRWERKNFTRPGADIYLRGRGQRRVPQMGDGNCMPNCISYYVGDPQELVRKKVVEAARQMDPSRFDMLAKCSMSQSDKDSLLDI